MNCRKIIATLILIAITSIDVSAAPLQCGDGADESTAKVCSDQELVRMHNELDEAVAQLALTDPNIKIENDQWIRSTRDRCLDAACMYSTYKERLAVVHEAIKAQLPSTSTLYSPSFKCSESMTTVETMICENEALSQADVSMAELFAERKKNKAVVAQQRSWEHDIRDKCGDVLCLEHAYATRISELNAAHQIAPGSTPQNNVNPSTAADKLAGLKAQSSAHADAMTILFWGVVLFFLIILAMGSTREIVICFDNTDFFWSVAPLLFLSGGLFISSTLSASQAGAENTLEQKAALGITGIAFAYSLAKNFINATKYNRSIPVGIVVGLFRLLLGLLALAIIFGALGGANKSRRGASSGALAALLLVGALFWIYRSVINGPEVYAKKGWQLAVP